MSQVALRAFFERLQGDAELQSKVKTVYTNNQAQAQASIIQLASDQGFQFTQQELEQLAAEAKTKVQNVEELQDTELEAVVGGSVEGWIWVSIISLGIGCAVTALENCNPSFSNQL